MKRFVIPIVLVTSALVVAVAGAVNYNAASSWFRGVVYAGSSKVQITDSTGNLVTSSGTYTGNVGVSGTLGVTGALTARSTLAVSGTLTAPTGTFTGPVGVSGALGVTGAVTLANASFLLTSVSADQTASTESAQGTTGPSGLISALVTHASTVGTNGDSYTLPDDAVGSVRMVCNAAAANNMDVFPFTSDSINKESANAAVNLVAGECMICLKMTAVKWGCVIGVAN